MLRASLTALLALAAFAAPVTPATAEPTVAAVDLNVTIAKFGQGNSSGTLDGVVLAGEGAFRSGVRITGSLAWVEPAATCPMASSAAGTMTTADGFTTQFTWTRLGTAVVVTFTGGVSTVAKFVVTSPVGNPCGASNVQARLVFSVAGDVPAPPRPARESGHVTIHRFPGRGPILLMQPLGWACADVNTGAPVQQGAVLASPDPGVECTPPAGSSAACLSHLVGGYFAASSTAGGIVTTAACGTFQSSVANASGSPRPATTFAGAGTLPLRCVVDETLTDPATTDYWTYCHVNR